MNNLEKYKNGTSRNTPNKVLEAIETDKKLFKYMYDLKVAPGVDLFIYHIDTKKKIISQFYNPNVVDYLKDNLPEGKILYIDYFEIKSRERDKGNGSKVIQDVIKTAKKIGLSGIYLDSYEESMDFWNKNGFSVDVDSQEDLNGESSDYHCGFINFNI